MNYRNATKLTSGIIEWLVFTLQNPCDTRGELAECAVFGGDGVPCSCESESGLGDRDSAGRTLKSGL